MANYNSNLSFNKPILNNSSNKYNENLELPPKEEMIDDEEDTIVNTSLIGYTLSDVTTDIAADFAISSDWHSNDSITISDTILKGIISSAIVMMAYGDSIPYGEVLENTLKNTWKLSKVNDTKFDSLFDSAITEFEINDADEIYQAVYDLLNN